MKRLMKISVVVLSVLLLATGCTKKEISENELVVGATPEPHAELLNLIAPDLEEAGYKLTVVEFTDYVIPNEAVLAGELDANYFQHLPYMEQFNAERKSDLVSAGGIHIEPIALYSSKYSSIGEFPDGAKIAIPNDPTNEGRALLLLQSNGLIKIDEKSGLTATPLDIVENPKNLMFSEIEAPSLPRIIQDVDGAIINGNYALPAGFNANKDGILIEGADSPYVNIVAVKAGNENLPKIQALVAALKSEKVAKYIKERYPNGDVIPVF